MRQLFILLLLAVLLWGFAPMDGQNFVLWNEPEYTPVAPAQSSEIKSEFLNDYGGEWQFIWNSETGQPHRIIGEGISIGEPKNGDDAVQLSLNFAGKNERIFPSQCELRPLSVRNAMNTWIVVFREYYRGLPVLTGRADFRIKRGNLVLIGADVHPNMDVDITPSLSPDEAQQIAAQEFQFSNSKSELMIAPFDGGELVWHLSAKNDSPVHRYHIFVDAHSGEILYWWDEIPTVYGEVTAMVHPLYEVDEPETVSMPNMHIENEGGDSTFTDTDGNYNIDVTFEPGMMIYGKLVGRYADVTPVSGVHSICGGGAPEEHFNLFIDEECAGLDETGGFYHVNVVHSFYKRLDPEYTAMDYPVPVAVSDTVPPCPMNSFWDGYGIHLGAGGGGYFRNFSFYADVIYHEYTHGTTHYIYPFDALPYSGQPGAMDEAFSDYFACAITGEPYIGELGLVIGQPWMRTLDNDLKYPDDWEGEVHADSRIISGAWWEIRDAITNHSFADSLVHFTRFTLANNFDDFAYEMLILDDDDGNIANGTPHDDEIMNAYIHHGIGGFGVKISHKPHSDTEDTLNPYRIRAELKTFTPIHWADLHYSLDGGETFTLTEFTETDTTNIWEAFIPAQPNGTTIYYYLSAEDWREFSDILPNNAPDSLFSFYVGQDTIPPIIKHQPLWDQSASAYPFQIYADISDNIEAPTSAYVIYGKNSSAPDTIEMAALGDNIFHTEMDFDDSVSVGDSVWYAIDAYDGASEPNFARSPESEYYAFQIVRSFFFDFEDSNGGFAASPGWEWGVPSYGPDGAYSGNLLWATRLDGPYDNNADWYLETVDIDLTDYSSAILQFWMWLQSERRYDGGQVLLRVDDGAPFLIEPIGGYNSRVVVALDGQPGFSGSTNGWKQVTFDLASYVGHHIKIQFRFASDDASAGAGWYIDDVAILETSFLMPPMNFRAESGYDEMVPLSWDRPSESVIEYLLYKNTTHTMPDEPIAHISADDTSYTDYDVVNEQRYFYWLVAVYERGNSVPAGPVHATPFRVIISLTPESLYVPISTGHIFDTIITVANLGMGNLDVDIFELPYGEPLLRTAPINSYTLNSANVARTMSQFLESSPISATTSFVPYITVPDPNLWHLLATDAREGVSLDIKKFFGELKGTGATTAYFRITGYESFGDPDSFAIAIMLDTDRNPSTGYTDGGGIEYMAVIANFMGYDGMVLQYNPDSPYGWDMVGPPSWIYHSENEDTVEIGFAVSSIGSPDAAYIRCASMAGLAGTSPEVIDLAPDGGENPVEFYFYNAQWLSENPVVDTISEEPHNITITVNSQGVPIGAYRYATLQFKSNDRENPDTRVPVVMHIVPAAVDEAKVPMTISLQSPKPSPFNSSTEIVFSISAAEKVKLQIFDELGREIRTLFDEKLSAGKYKTVWYGDDNNRNAVTSGIYFIKLSTDGKTIIRRTALIK